MDKIMKRVAQAALALLSGLLLPGCSLDKDDPDIPSRVDCPFSYSLDTMSVAATRSILTDAAIEDRVGSVTLAAYSAEGVLSASDHFSGDGVSSMRLDLTEGDTYKVYALVNMGDVTDDLPSSSAAMESFVYEVPSYSDVNVKGLPMAGVLSGYVAGGSEQPVIRLRRLFAKVTADLALAYGDATITEVRIRNLNGRLIPFGEGAARSADDILADEEWSAASGSYGTYVFYVPENMQGTIGSASTSHDKNPDADDAIASAEDRLTYMEVDVALDGRDYAGNVTYRSFLGEDALKDFDVKGNYRYIWRVTYDEDNLQYDDWKIDTDGASFFDYELEVVPGSLDLKVGQKETLKAYHYRITDGVRGQATDVTSKAVWSSQRTAVAAVDAGEVTAKSQGTSVVTATYDGISATADVAVSDDITYELEVTPSSADISWNEEVSLTAMYYRITNGVTDSGKDVTSSANWSSSRTGVATVTSSGVVKGVAGGTATITATYSGMSATASITVKDVVTHEFVLSPESASIDFGETVSFSALYYTTTNGKTTYSDVTASASWSRSGTALTSTGIKGEYVGENAGSSTVTATYQGHSASAVVTVKKEMSYRLEVDPSSVSLRKGDSQQIDAVYVTVINGEDYSTADVTSLASWSVVSGGSYAQVSNGLVTGRNVGSARVRATYAGKSAEVAVTVTEPVVQSMTLSQTGTVYLLVSDYAQTLQLSAAAGLSDGTEITSGLTWKSDNQSVATVSSSGLVTPVGYGSTSVTVSYTSGGVTKSASLTVRVSVMSISPTETSIDVGKRQNYSVTIVNYSGNSSSATYSSTWETSNSSVLDYVNYGLSYGQFIGVAAGTATVTASYDSTYGKGYVRSSVSVTDVVTYESRIEIFGGSEVAVGKTMQLSVRRFTDTYTNGVLTGEDTSGVAVDASQVTWSVEVGTSHASVSADGVVTGKSKTSSVLARVKAVLKNDTSLYAKKEIRVVGDSSVSPDPDWDDEGNIEL